ncbi:MAG: hypothetical protein N3H31_04215 [Candidatus Nezhaarchaeota archaeon]|nr:hypothetical protein [Candidatus Nezhaarchaeota archaeon]
MTRCKVCGVDVEERRVFCSKCLERLELINCPFCGEALIHLDVGEALLRHKCGAYFHPSALQVAMDGSLKEALKAVCGEYGCEGAFEDCYATCPRVREFIELGTSKIKPILEPVLKNARVSAEYGWKTCLIRDGNGLLAVLIDQHNPSYLSEGPSTPAVEGLDKATIIGAELTERQLSLLKGVEEALRSHGYTDIMKVFLELPGETGTEVSP